MNKRTRALLQLAVPVFLLAILAIALPAQGEVPSQTTVHETLTATAEVVSVDPATRHITLRGPLGGKIMGRVEDEVKNLGQVKAGDMVTITYHASVAMSASKPGQPSPLFTGGDTSTSAEGERPSVSVSEQTKTTVTVVSVDPEKRSLVLQSEDGSLLPVEVDRPEFARKLQNLKPGDKIDVVLTEAVIAEVTPAAPGAKPKVSYTSSTLVVERGEVLWRNGNTILVRGENGRSVRVTVDPKYKFKVDGKDVTVAQLKPGTKLTRTALRTEKVESE